MAESRVLSRRNILKAGLASIPLAASSSFMPWKAYSETIKNIEPLKNLILNKVVLRIQQWKQEV